MSELSHPRPELSVADVAIPVGGRRDDLPTRVPPRAVPQNARHGQRKVLHCAVHDPPPESLAAMITDSAAESARNRQTRRTRIASRGMAHPSYPPPRPPKPPIATTDRAVSIGAIISRWPSACWQPPSGSSR